MWFSLTCVCFAEFCLSLPLPLQWKHVPGALVPGKDSNISALYAEAVGWAGLDAVVQRLFPHLLLTGGMCFWYWVATLALLIDSNWNYELYLYPAILCRGSCVFISVTYTKKKEKKIHLNSICVFFVIPSLVISPPLVLFPVRTVYRGRTERWSIVCLEASAAYCQ